MLIDARDIESDTEFKCDLCIVGAGFAGIAIADRLRSSGLSIVLLESGGMNPELASQKLYHGESQGCPYFRLDACRWRLFGGGGNRWGGWCRPLDAVDFTQREWLPHSGWPIDDQTLRPYEADAARLLELPDAPFDLTAWRHRLPEPLAIDENFENALIQLSPETNFGDRYRARLLASTNITTIIYANLTRMRLGANSQRICELQIATLTGRKFTVRPRAVVIAAGGVENARLLLASRSERSEGLGNEFDLVGRYFMEHLHVPVGHMLAASDATHNDFYRKTTFGKMQMRGIIVPTMAARSRHQFLTTSIALECASYSFGTDFVGWPPLITFIPSRCYRKLYYGRFKRLAKQLKQFAHRIHAVPIRIRTWKMARIARSRAFAANKSGQMFSLYFRAEQAPHSANRIVLSERCDALGVPESRLEWRVQSMDTASINGWFEVLERDVRTRGLGQLIRPPDDWQRGIIGGPHHMGTTRMSSDPRRGVVDAECRVHSVDNLYVAGSSVFATSGYANPTFALVTLALRLADTLHKRLRN